MEFVFDRTESDVLLGSEKGRYTYQDLNRVESAVDELCRLAKPLDINLVLQVKTDWTEPKLFSADSWPTESQMRRYLQNVHRLCNALDLNCTLPTGMTKLNWEGANAIEKALSETLTRIQEITSIYQYSGELIAGKEQVL